MSSEKKFSIEFTEQELRIIKSALTEEIKKSDKNSKKWDYQLLGPNPFFIVSEKLRGMMRHIAQSTYRVK